MSAELLRKSTHLLGLLIPILYFFFDKSLMLVIVGSLTCIALCVELAKWLFLSFRNLFYQYLSILLRSHEKEGAITGATYYIIATLISIFVFEESIAIACLFFIGLGDTVAALVGRQWGNTKLIGKKSLEGSVACFTVCGITALFLLNPIIGFIGAFVATLAELLPLRINDNLTVPLISGAVMQLMINYLPLHFFY